MVSLLVNDNYIDTLGEQRETYVTTAIKQGRSKQDFYWACSNREGDIMILCDGHGSNRVIDIVRNYDFSKYLCDSTTKSGISDLNPCTIIKDLQRITNVSEKINFIPVTKSSGSTITIAIYYQNIIKIAWMGDSQALLLKDGKQVFITNQHNSEEDPEGLLGKNLKTEYVCHQTPDGNMTQMVKPYIDYSDPSKNIHDICAVTRALGHDNRTFNKPDYKEIKIDSVSDWKLILATDGMYDVLGNTIEDHAILWSKNAQEICDIAAYRWSSEYVWNFIPINHPPFQTQFSEGDADDIAIISWSNFTK